MGARRRRGGAWARLALFSLAAALFLLGYYWGNQYRRTDFPALEAGIQLRPPLDLPGFGASDPSGSPAGRAWFGGRWSLLLIDSGEAGSSDAQFTLLSRVFNRLAQHPGLQQTVSPVRVSRQPAETPTERSQDAASGFRYPLFAMAVSPDGFEHLRAALGAPEPGSPEVLYLVDPQAQAVALFTGQQDPATIARDIRSILDARGR